MNNWTYININTIYKLRWKIFFTVNRTKYALNCKLGLHFILIVVQQSVIFWENSTLIRLIRYQSKKRLMLKNQSRIFDRQHVSPR